MSDRCQTNELDRRAAAEGVKPMNPLVELNRESSRASSMAVARPDSWWHTSCVACAQTGELELVAADVVAGHTDLEIARHMGVSVRTVARRKALPETQELVEEARRDAAREIRTGVIDGALAGLERLLSVVSSPHSPDGAAVNASKYLIDLAVGPDRLAALVDPLPAGHRCESCGHDAPDEAGRSVATQAVMARLEEVRGRLEAGEVVKESLGGEPASTARL